MGTSRAPVAGEIVIAAMPAPFKNSRLGIEEEGNYSASCLDI